MININDADLETALRALASQSGHTISSVARALMRIGMKAKPSAITAEIVALRKPMGRPPTLPTKEAEVVNPMRKQPEEDQMNYMRRIAKIIKARKATEKGKK